MNDYLVELGQIRAAKKIVQTMGVPVPQKLERAKGPWRMDVLKGKSLLVGGLGGLHPMLGKTLSEAGALLSVAGDEASMIEAYQKTSRVKYLKSDEPVEKCHALVYDGTALTHPEDLHHMYQFFHRGIRNIKTNGRVVVIGRPVAAQTTVAAASASHALEGFVRSVAKEVGRKGATAQLIYAEDNPVAHARLNGLLLFLLSPRSAFVSGQVFSVTSKVKGDDVQNQHQALKGKVALVTGAARGIGAATAKSLAHEGAKVICLDRPEDEKPLAEVALAIGGKILLQDISKEDAPRKIQGFIKEHFGGVDIVIHNAGITRDKTLGKMAAALWDSTMKVNLISVLDMTETLLEDGLNENGRIICLSSISGIAGNFGQTNYAASKSGLIGLVEAMAEKVKDRGITVNAVAPGFIETRLTAAIPFFTREAARRLSNVSQGGLPEDIANMITFLSTPSAAGITGSVVRVCGGSLIGA